MGSRTATTPEHAVFVRGLRGGEDQGLLFPGCSFDLDERFPSAAEKAFSAGVFREVAGRVQGRELGNHEIDTWRASADVEAQQIGRMLDEAGYRVEPL